MGHTSVYAYVLHRRPFKETSYLVDILTLELGRIRCVIHSARTQNKNKQITEPFCRYMVHLSGKSDLKNAKIVEPIRAFQLPMGTSLYSGMYLNELLVRSERQHQPNLDTFAAYEWALSELAASTEPNKVLRHVELLLLSAHGFSVDFSRDSEGFPIENRFNYGFEPGRGFLRGREGCTGLIPGQTLVDLAQDLYNDAHKRVLTQICRQALLPLVGHEPFKSRDLFKRYVTASKS